MSSHPPDTGWHIDQRCTNCDVACQLAPELIGEVGGHPAAALRRVCLPHPLDPARLAGAGSDARSVPAGAG